MYIVTGAAGFIGSCIIKDLNDKGITDIICIDRLEDDDKWLNLRGLYYSEYIHADEFIQSDVIYSIFEEKEIKAVYHMGACSSTTERDVDYLMYNNVDYTKVLFSMCTEFDTPIVYASSAATYGAGENGYDDKHDGIDKLIPLNAYGYSKQLVDEWALRQDDTPSKWYGVKFFNVYGPNEYHKGNMQSVVSQAFKQISETGAMKLFKSYKDGFADGQQLRDFVYVKDVVRAMIMLTHEEHKGANGIYNLGAGKARSFYDLVDSTFKGMDKKTNIEFVEMPESIRDQYQYFTEANTSKLQGVFPDFKFHTLEEGVKDYVTNYLMQPDQRLSSRR
jgi:ADP-L-glycero-D-manno-heptose 6-epimerase